MLFILKSGGTSVFHEHDILQIRSTHLGPVLVMYFEISQTPTNLTPGRVSNICACILYDTLPFPFSILLRLTFHDILFFYFRDKSSFSLQNNKSNVHLIRLHVHKFLFITFSQRSPFFMTLEIRKNGI